MKTRIAMPLQIHAFAAYSLRNRTENHSRHRQRLLISASGEIGTVASIAGTSKRILIMTTVDSVRRSGCVDESDGWEIMDSQ